MIFVIYIKYAKINENIFPRRVDIRLAVGRKYISTNLRVGPHMAARNRHFPSPFLFLSLRGWTSRAIALCFLSRSSKWQF
jgi:hypothetical protein